MESPRSSISRVQIIPPGGTGAAQTYRPWAIPQSTPATLGPAFLMLCSLLGTPASPQAASPRKDLRFTHSPARCRTPSWYQLVCFMLQIIEKPM